MDFWSFKIFSLRVLYNIIDIMLMLIKGLSPLARGLKNFMGLHLIWDTFLDAWTFKIGEDGGLLGSTTFSNFYGLGITRKFCQYFMLS